MSGGRVQYCGLFLSGRVGGECADDGPPLPPHSSLLRPRLQLPLFPPGKLSLSCHTSCHSFLFSPQSPLVALDRDQERLAETNITRGFIIAKPRRRDSKSNRRVCLIYLIVNNSDNITHNNNSLSVSYWWSVGKTECQRNILPGTTIFQHHHGFFILKLDNAFNQMTVLEY